jgi:chlorobactene glucosyltransferase
MLFLLALPLLVLLTVAVTNHFAFPRLAQADAAALPRRAPALSVCIPARDEAAVIGETVRRLLAQEYPGPVELLLLDDHSTDGTAAAARAAAAGDARLRVLCGADLPPGWAGKVWACHQLAQAAAGDLLLFTDADVSWEPGALAAAAGKLHALRGDLLTVWPTQITVTWAEHLVVPMMSMGLLAYLPISWAHNLPYASAAAANGQCLLYRRVAYARAGGHAAVRGSVLDDVLMAQRLKASGGSLRMADGTGLIRARMYSGWPAVRDGYAKNILAGHRGSPALLVASTIFHLAIFVLPWLGLLLGRLPVFSFLLSPFSFPYPWSPLILIVLGLAVRLVTARTAGHRLRDAWLLPVSVLLMTRIALQSLWWRFKLGGPVWKGRVVGKS